jgi:hypothetical protein
MSLHMDTITILVATFEFKYKMSDLYHVWYLFFLVSLTL